MIFFHSDLLCIFHFLKIQLKKCPNRPPEAPTVLSVHSSFLSQTQLSLIPCTALCYPGHRSALSCTALCYPKHSSYISSAPDIKELCVRYERAVQDKKELCLGWQRAVLGIRKSCVWDKKDLGWDKTVRASRGLLGRNLSSILKKRYVR